MRKVVATVMAVAVLAGCAQGTKPNPKPKKTAAITAPAVVLCVDEATLVRYKDAECVPEGQGVWIYVQNTPMWPDELPAVRERLESGRGQFLRPNMEIANVPEAGGFFAGK